MKIRIGIAVVICVLCLGFTAPQQTQEEARAQSLKEWTEAETRIDLIKLWTEPVEVAYIIPIDGKAIIRITSGLAKKIYFKPSIPEILADYGYEIKDIHIWVHNHLSTNGFSLEDVVIYWYLRANDFVGLYLLKTAREVLYYAGEEEKKDAKS